MGVAEEPHVPQLVDLVRPDALLGVVLLVPRDVRRGRPEEAHPCPREGDLRGGGENVGTVRVPGRSSHPDDVVRGRRLVDEGVHGVGVVPEDPEVGCRGRHLDERAGDLLGVDRSRGVGVGRDGPDALDRGIGGDELTDHVHVGAVSSERHRDHLDAERLGDREVAVVARAGREELHDGLG